MTFNDKKVEMVWQEVFAFEYRAYRSDTNPVELSTVEASKKATRAAQAERMLQEKQHAEFLARNQAA